MIRSRFALAFAFAFATGCSAVLHFNECTTDPDCAGRGGDGGAMLYCTSDHLCVNALPEERLCKELIGADPTSKDTVMVAGLFRLSGAAGDKDTEMSNAARLAIAEVNQAMQRPIGMVLCDTAGTDASQSVRSIEKAARSYHIVGMVGPTTSTHVSGVKDTLRRLDLLSISPSATSPAITSLDDGNLIWRTAASDTLQAGVLAQIIPLQNTATPPAATRVDVAYVNTSYGGGLFNAFVAEWTKRSGQAPVSATKFETGSPSDAVVAKLGADAPDYSLIVADDDASNLVASLYKNPAGLGSTQFLFTDGAKGPNLVGMTPNLPVDMRIRGTGPANPSGAVFSSFQLTYKSQFGSDPAATSFVANTYDATYALALTIAGTPPDVVLGGAQLASVLQRMSAGLAVNVNQTGYVQGATALKGGGTIKLDGTSGPLQWDANGDDVTAPIEVWGIDTTRTPPPFCTISPSPRTCP